MLSLINNLTNSHRVQVTHNNGRYSDPSPTEEIHVLNLLAPELFFLILAHPVYKM